MGMNQICLLGGLRYVTDFLVSANQVIVDFRITWTLCRCRRELRFPTIKAFSRDSEIAPTEEV